MREVNLELDPRFCRWCTLTPITACFLEETALMNIVVGGGEDLFIGIRCFRSNRKIFGVFDLSIKVLNGLCCVNRGLHHLVVFLNLFWRDFSVYAVEVGEKGQRADVGVSGLLVGKAL